MASKALLPALVLLALVCGQLVIDGSAQTYIGGPRARPPAREQPLPYVGGGAPAGMQQPAPYTGRTPGYDGTGMVPAVEAEKAFMISSVPAHDRARPVPVPPTAN